MALSGILRLVRLPFIALLVAFTVPLAHAQQPTGTIAGRVTDVVTQQPLAGVTVTVMGTTLGGISRPTGDYSITVPVGMYRVRASKVGYEPVILTDVVVAAGKQTTLDIALRETTLQLESVTVTPDYFPSITTAPVSLRDFGNEEIRRLPGGLEDVVRAVSIVPGVAQVQQGRNDLVVRGGAPSENLYTVDNIPIPNINHFATQGASGGPLSFVNLDYVKDTRFSTGGFGVRDGDKLSSVLALDLRDGRTDRIGGKATISASQFGLNLDGPISEDGSFLVSVRRSYLDFIFKAAGFGFVPEYWDFLGKASYAITPHDRVTILNIGAIDDVKLFNDTPDQRYDNAQVLVSSQREYVAGATWRHLFSSGYFTLTAAQTVFTYDYAQTDTNLRPIFTDTSREYETSIRAEALVQLSRTASLIVGAEARPLRFAGDILLPPFATSAGDTVSVNVHPDLSALKGGAYVELTLEMMDRLRATIGGRANYFDLLATHFSGEGRVSLSYALSRVTSLTASAGIYHQSPSTIWIATNEANRDLSFIRCDQYIAGIEHLVRSDTKVSLEIYRKNYSDYAASTVQPYLVLASTGAGFGGAQEGFASFGIVPLTSVGKGYAQGAELFVQKKLSDVPCYGTAGATWSEAYFAGRDGVYRPGAYDQRWIVNLGGGYLFGEEWEVSAKFRLSTGRPYTPYLPTGLLDTSRINSARTEVNHSLDLRVDKRWNFARWNLITYLDVQDVYNHKFTDIPRWDLRTQQPVFDTGIGLLPSVGVSAEF